MKRILIVTPHSLSCGEAVTGIHVAIHLAASGWRVHFLASPITAGLVPAPFDVSLLSGNLRENQAKWKNILVEFKPGFVLFADYPLLAEGTGSLPLADENWLGKLDRLDCILLTFDHLHLTSRNPLRGSKLPHSPKTPDSMSILLPCPNHSPGAPTDEKRFAFRYWQPPPALTEERRIALRSRYLKTSHGLLVLHAVPRWAQAVAAAMNHPLYQFLPRLLCNYLQGLPQFVTVISVNDGTLLSVSEQDNVRIINLPSMPPDRFEELLVCSDLVLSENCFSVGLGKAVCSGVPAILWRHTLDPVDVLTSTDKTVSTAAAEMILQNPKSLDSWVAFPNWNQSLMSEIGSLPDEPGMLAGVQCLELFGGHSTRDAVHALLSDGNDRRDLRMKQFSYSKLVSNLPLPEEVIQKLHGFPTDAHRSS